MRRSFISSSLALLLLVPVLLPGATTAAAPSCEAGGDAPASWAVAPLLAPGVECHGAVDPAGGDALDTFLIPVAPGEHARVRLVPAAGQATRLCAAAAGGLEGPTCAQRPAGLPQSVTFTAANGALWHVTVAGLAGAGAYALALDIHSADGWSYVGRPEYAKMGAVLAVRDTLHFVGGDASGVYTGDGRNSIPTDLVLPLTPWGVGAPQVGAPLPAGRVPRGIQLDADHVLIAGGPAKDESCNGRRAYVGRAASDGSIAEWSRAPDLPNVGDGLPIFAARPRGTTVDVYYEEGGALGCSGYPSNRIWRATYSAGALGGWTLAAHQPAPTKGGAAMVVVGDWLYFLGGGACCPGGPLAHVHRAPIAADGSLGAWIVDAPLPKPAVHANALVFDGGILVLGAHGPDNTRNPEVWWSPLRADGSLDGWRTIGRVPPFLMSDGVAFEAAGRVFAGDFDREPTAASSVGVASAPSALLRAWIAASL